MTTPEFITFTGADDKTNVRSMEALAADYPVEFGILMSPSRVGSPRFPSSDWIDTVTGRGLRLSAHVCGGYARTLEVNIPKGGGRDDLDLEGFTRLQLNTTRSVSPKLFREWARHRGVRPILQCRSEFLADEDVAWLFDRSGGRGVLPDVWPMPRTAARVGYAGGLGPDTIAAALQHFREPYWIDMESKVRNGDDAFDLGLCRRVCEIVYDGRKP